MDEEKIFSEIKSVLENFFNVSNIRRETKFKEDLKFSQVDIEDLKMFIESSFNVFLSENEMETIEELIMEVKKEITNSSLFYAVAHTI